MKFRHIIVSRIARAIIDSPKNTQITISSLLIEETESKFYQITIQDLGFGLSVGEIQQIQKNISGENDDYLFGLPTRESEYSAKLVSMHQGYYSSHAA